MQQYLQIPKNIKARVYQLVKKITHNSKNNYNKINKIKQYLSNHYAYSLDVSDLPANEEFIDYFLFTEKKGYCSYFATATAIFARISGIPARYVEGFRMRNQRDTSRSDQPLLVTNDMAHAWVEVLLYPKSNDWIIVDSVPKSYFQQLPYYVKTMTKENQKGLKKHEQKKLANINSPNQNSSTSSFQNLLKETCNIIVVFMVIILFLFILLSTYKIWRIKRNKELMLQCQSVIPIYQYSNKRLCVVSISSQPHISDLEAAMTIKDPDLRRQMIRLARVFYEEFFGGNVTNDFDKLEHYRFLENYIRERQSFSQYYFHLLKNE
jgi:hypothetical protein